MPGLLLILVDRFKSIPLDVANQKHLTIECSLYGIAATGNKWNNSAIDLMRHLIKW